MKVGLYNIDSSLPNLALMKIASFYKSKGSDVNWCNTQAEASDFDKVYGSQIFTDSKTWRAKNLEIGGTGVSLEKTLPDEIEQSPPDYSIYPDFKDNIGFVTRGCIRKCKFCVVPKKEGTIHSYIDIEKLWRGWGNIILFDNNILAMPNKFKSILEFTKNKSIKVDFNQGLDCRLVDEAMAKTIIKYKSYIKPQVRFAFDDLAYKQSVERTCKLLKFRCFWYVYCDENYESALERLLILKRLKQTAYLMRDKSLKNQQKFIWLSKWVNSMGAYKKMDIWDVAIKKYENFPAMYNNANAIHDIEFKF